MILIKSTKTQIMNPMLLLLTNIKWILQKHNKNKESYILNYSKVIKRIK